MSDKLSEQETWEGEHLSELALSCLADGQDVIDPVARVHAESCAECARRVGAMALESYDVGAALRRGKELAARPAAAAHRFPTVLVAAAAVFAAPRTVPILTSSFVALTESLGSGPSGAAVSLVATFTLALIGYAVARASRTRGVPS
jgi:hypothetical protein